MSTRERGKRMLKNVVALGVTIALMVAMTATVAAAQSDKTKAYGLNKEPICHNGHTLYLPEPAIAAHLAHHDDDSSGVCGLPPAGPPVECENPVEGAAIEADESLGTTLDVVDAGDVLSIAGDFELAASGTVSVTVEDEDGTQGTFEDGVNAEITQEEDGSLLITVSGDPIPVDGAGGEDDVLDTTGLTGVSSEGITCTEEGEGTIGTTEAVDDAVLQPTLSASAIAAYAAEQVTDHQGPPEPFAHPFCDSGREYAQEHITGMAQNETPGLTGPPTAREADPVTEHAPGAHQGFAVCDPSAN
jgi:hypothetical protein